MTAREHKQSNLKDGNAVKQIVEMAVKLLCLFIKKTFEGEGEWKPGSSLQSLSHSKVPGNE